MDEAGPFEYYQCLVLKRNEVNRFTYWVWSCVLKLENERSTTPATSSKQIIHLAVPSRPLRSFFFGGGGGHFHNPLKVSEDSPGNCLCSLTPQSRRTVSYTSGSLARPSLLAERFVHIYLCIYVFIYTRSPLAVFFAGGFPY